MKKYLYLAATAALCLALLTGCSCSHQWTEASCAEPKTCTNCGVTEGEALTHSWTEASCAAPKTCASCGETEGEALTHSWTEASCAAPRTCANCGETEGEALAHTWVDANLQAPKTCTVCAATEGEPLPADFERLGLTIDVTETGVPCTFTVGGNDFTACIHSWDTATAEEIVAAHQEKYGPGLETYISHIQEEEGYVWQRVHLTLEGSGVTSLNTIPVLADYGDYYDLDGLVSSLVESPDQPSRFTVNFHGEDFAKCAYTTYYNMEHTDTTLKIEQWMFFRLPVGYDGMVISFGDASITIADYYANYMDFYTNENTVSFRIH